MNCHFYRSICIAFCLCAGGCAGLFQSPEIKQEAIKLDSDVLAFKAQQQKEVDTLNKTFQDTSESLMDQLTLLCNAELDLERDLNAQAIADQAVLDPNKVLMPGSMHDASLAYINDQFLKIQAVEDQISTARTTYASSSKTLQVALDQLTNCDTALKKLIADNPGGDILAILQDIQGTYDGVKAGLAANASTGTGAAPKAPAIPL